MKVWAFAKHTTGNYVKKNDGKLKCFLIHEALSMRKYNPEKYNSLAFMSTHFDENKRKKMSPDKRGFFKYIENVGINEGYSVDGDSISHSMAIAVLSEFQDINFKIRGREFLFKFDDIRIDDLKILLPNKNYYYPDLIGFFKEPKALSEKWGGKVAIEVKVKHGCESIKIKDFEEHNIPILEITLTEKMQFLKELRKEPFDENDLKNYYEFLKEKFSEVALCKVISNPISLKYYKKERFNLKQKMDSYISKIEEYEQNIPKVVDYNKKMKKILGEMKTENEKLSSEIQNLTLKNNGFNNRSFWQKLKDLF